MTSFQSYRSMPWTSDNDECEGECGQVMNEEHYVLGELGHYCSETCREDHESGGLEPSQREDFHSDG